MDGTLLALTTRGVTRYQETVYWDWPGGQEMVGQHWSSCFSTTQFFPTGLMNGQTLEQVTTWWHDLMVGRGVRRLTLGSTWASGCDTCSWGRARWWRSVLPRCSVCIGSSSLTSRRLQILPQSPMTTTTLTIIWECQLSVAIPIVYWSWNKHYVKAFC